MNHLQHHSHRALNRYERARSSALGTSASVVTLPLFSIDFVSKVRG